MAASRGDGYDIWLADLDGTLVDVRRSYVFDVLGRVADRLGCAFGKRETVRLWYGTDGVRRRVLRSRDVTVDEFWSAFESVRDPHARVDATFLYDDAAGLGALDAPLGLVTHCPAPITADVLDTVGIRDWFDAVVCCDADLGWKPDPAPVRRAIARLDDAGDGVPAETIADGGHSNGVLIGDSPVDVGAARATGFDAVHVERNDPNLRGRCVLGDRRVSGIDELLP